MPADLSTAQLEKLKSVFEQALPVSREKRADFLRQACGDDAALCNEVESLLNAHEQSDGFFEALSNDIVGPVLGTPPDTGGNRSTTSGNERDVLKIAGRTISHFHVLEPLAAGGMGVVYRATDTHLGRPVALKFPLPGARLEHDMRERFLREARGAGALDHPNICSIYEAGETEEGQLFLAMPLYAGETLKARLEREGRLPIDEAVRIAEQIARGLHAAARAGIVHRDLKPANVMILPDGTVKILDFGIARVSDMALTASRSTLGTVPYMAPEHVLGEEVDSRADIWALGVLLYEMLTGQRPFGGKHQIAVAHSIVHSDPVPPSKIRPEVPAKLDHLVLRMLAKQPENRPASADVVVAELGGASPLSARSDGHLSPSPTVRSSRRLFIRVAAVALVATAAGVMWWQMQGDPAAGATDPRSIAVLPFTEVGAPDTSASLGVALAAEVSTALSRLRSVAVPAEASISEVAASVSAPATIATLLGAAAVVRGSVRRTGNDVTLQLAVFDSLRKRDVWTGEHTSPRGNVVALQKRAIEEIVSALDLDVSGAERATLVGVSSVSGGAYDLYLKGRAAQLRAGSGGATGSSGAEFLKLAQSYFARAREIDRNFAEARAHLALTQLALAGEDRTSTRRDHARFEAEAALRSRPGMSEAHEALSRYWMLRGDRANAAAEAERALAGRPHAPHLHILLGMNYRNLARWEEALTALERASRLDPRNRVAHRQAALTYGRIRRYREGIAHWDRMITMDSARDPFPQIIRGYSYLRLGIVDSLDAAISRIPLAPDAGGMTTYARYIVHRIRGRHAQLLAVLDSARLPVSSDSLVYLPVTLMRAQTFESMGDAARARANYEAVRSLLEDSVAVHPRDARMRIALGLAYAGLGRRADAIREARSATEIVPLTESSPIATAFMGGAVEIYARLGEADAALDLIEMLLAMPAGREISVPLLRVDPVYDKLRRDPRFSALLDRLSTG